MTAASKIPLFHVVGFSGHRQITHPEGLAKAIRAALKEARAGDIVILAGKGHETYQVLKDRVIHFDDREVARDVLQELGYHQ